MEIRMSNEVSPLTKIQETIKDRIKEEFVSLLPPEIWNEMVSSVLKDFTADEKTNIYGSKIENYESPIKKLIRKEIEDASLEAVKKELNKLDVARWDHFGNSVAGEAVTKLIEQNFKEILDSVQKGFVEMAVGLAVSHIRNAMHNGMRS